MRGASVLPKNTAESTGKLPPVGFNEQFVAKLDERTTGTDTDNGNKGGQSDEIR